MCFSADLNPDLFSGFGFNEERFKRLCSSVAFYAYTIIRLSIVIIELGFGIDLDTDPSCLTVVLVKTKALPGEDLIRRVCALSCSISGTCRRWSCWWTTTRASRRRLTPATTASQPALSWAKRCWPGSTTLQTRWRRRRVVQDTPLEYPAVWTVST